MKYCPSCRVSVPSSRSHCPLCQGALAPGGSDTAYDGEIFPHIPTLYRQHSLLFRLLIFASILVAVVAGVLSLLVFTEGFWSLFVLAGVGAMWLTLAVAVRKRSSLTKRILYQLVTWGVVLVAFDALTGWRGWSMDFAVPFLFLTGMGCTFVLAVLSRRKLPDHIIYFVVSAGFCLLPPVFLLLGWAKVLWPSVICAACGIVALSGVALFAERTTRSELKKRLHL